MYNEPFTPTKLYVEGLKCLENNSHLSKVSELKSDNYKI